MRADLDELMQSTGLDAIVVLGDAEHNPPMYYLTGGGHVSNAALFKKPGSGPCPLLQRHGAGRGRQEWARR